MTALSTTKERNPAATLPAEEECWEAVRRKDPSADGKFYYSVRTTGIYCRPSCPSRPALRRNVAFHSSCEEAENAGFRACHRCQPSAASLAQRRASAVARACRIMDSAEEPPSLRALALAVNLSPFHFHRVFKQVTGVTPRAYARGQRAQRLREELPRARTVTEAIYGAGFNSSGNFYAECSHTLGMKPSCFRRGGAGESIRFAVGECSLGSILMAVSEHGVCSIALGDDPNALVADLQHRFPQACLIGHDPVFEQWMARVVGLVEAPGLGLDLPLDLRGTVFQQRVWQALRAIPAGSMATYSEVAHQIGAPGAVRAVARACASNAIAIAIPCHRVVRRDGSLSGYRWGAERKRLLLERERAD